MKRLLLLAAFLSLTSSAYGQVNLGTSSSATNPQRSGDATTGVFSPATGAVAISSAGVEIARVNGTGVGIGTTSPQYLLDVNGNTTAAPGTAINGTVLHVMGANTVVPRVMMDAFGIANGGALTFRSAEGTAASPTATNSGDNLGRLTAFGYGTTSYSSVGRATIEFLADQNWTDTAQGTDIAFLTTPDGSTTVAEVMRITAAGNVGIGTSSPGNPLSVNGVIQSQTGGFKFPDGTTQTSAATVTGGFASVHVQTFTSSGTYTPTTGMAFAVVRMLGGGGGGGGIAASIGGGAGGGQGGAYSEGVFSAATIGASQAVTIGAGGTGVSGSAGNSGGQTSLGALMTAPGGTGAPAQTSGSAGYVPYPNLGGFSSSTGSGGYTNLPGPAGGTGAGLSYNNSYYLSGIGGNGIFNSGGGQAVSGYVAGGSTSGANGNNATGYGAGGGGAGQYNLDTSSVKGGNGSAGVVIITEYCN